MSHASTQEYFLFYVWLDAGVVVVLVGIRPRLLGTKHYRVCDVTDHRCGTRGTGRLFVRGLETWDLWGKKNTAVLYLGRRRGASGFVYVA